MKKVNFVLSKAFKERLKNIKSPITDALLAIKKVDFESNNYRNFISISNDDKTMISFVDRNKENKINETLVEFEYVYWSFYSLNEGDEITLKPCAFSHYKDENGVWKKGSNYIRFPYFNQKLNHKIKYIYSPIKILLNNHLETKICSLDVIEVPNKIKKVPKTVNKEIWNPEKRIKTKAGKFIKTIFENKFTDKEINDWVYEYQKQTISECGENGLFKELEGESIRFAYHENNYIGKSGDLSNSCMRYEKCQKYLDIYCKNSDKVGLLTIVEDNKVRARSILWYPEGKSSNKKWHDRIYTNNNEDKQLMEVYLKLNNFEDIYRNKNFADVSIKLNNVDFEYYPYMDTFKYLNGNTLTTNDDDCWDKKLESTSGDYETREHTCDCCGDFVDEADLYYINRGDSRGDNLCDNCCTYCEDIDECVHNDDAVYSNYSTCYFYAENTVYSHHLNSHILESEAICLYEDDYTHEDKHYYESEEGHCFIDTHGFVEIDGLWYLESNSKIYYNEETEEWDLIINKKQENELVSTE